MIGYLLFDVIAFYLVGWWHTDCFDLGLMLRDCIGLPYGLLLFEFGLIVFYVLFT